MNMGVGAGSETELGHVKFPPRHCSNVPSTSVAINDFVYFVSIPLVFFYCVGTYLLPTLCSTAVKRAACDLACDRSHLGPGLGPLRVIENVLNFYLLIPL